MPRAFFCGSTVAPARFRAVPRSGSILLSDFFNCCLFQDLLGGEFLGAVGLLDKEQVRNSAS
jgi:hypothetical protein